MSTMSLMFEKVFPLAFGTRRPGVCGAEPPHERVGIRRENDTMNG